MAASAVDPSYGDGPYVLALGGRAPRESIEGVRFNLDLGLVTADSGRERNDLNDRCTALKKLLRRNKDCGMAISGLLPFRHPEVYVNYVTRGQH